MFDPQGLKPGTPNHGLKNRGLRRAQAPSVKVQRPKIEQLVRMDLGSLKFVIRVITRFVDTSSLIDLKGAINS